ncbi:hypothetical protein [Cecembia calidifontis]|uniref:hypothetical protein n=1 Tax=Cecembia calidifontis TaxID=1187080 RepID=UPI001028BB4E|nr:hypothetical protein [Cecembia calidifontis]
MNKSQFDGKIFDLKNIKDYLQFSKNEEAVLFYVKIKSPKINNGLPIPLFDLEGYEEFVLEKFQKSGITKGLNYLTGEINEDILVPDFTGRDNINKVFQLTTINHITDFDLKNLNQCCPK